MTGADLIRPRSPHLARNVALVVGAILAVLLGVLATSSPKSGDEILPSPLIGRVAPDFEGTSLLDGSSVSLAGLRSQNRFVLVNFFGSYCIPCRKEHPELVKVAAAHPDDLAIVSIMFEETSDDDAIEFFRTNGGEWALLSSRRIPVDYGVAKIPESFLVAPSGVVLTKVSGALSADRLEALLTEAKALGS